MNTDSQGDNPIAIATATEQSASEETLGAELQEIWARFRGQMIERVETIEAALVALVEGHSDPASRANAVRDAHRLAGSAGTFGRHEASRIAREIEHLFENLATPSDAEITHLLELTEELRDSLTRAPVTTEAGRSEVGLVAVVHRDASFRAALSLACESSGYASVTAKKFKTLQKKLAARSPTVLIFELGSDEKILAKLKEALGSFDSSCAVFAISDKEKLSFRVRAMGYGVGGFLSTLLSAEEVVAHIKETIVPTSILRARILAIDDDPLIAATLTAILGAAGFDFAIAADPDHFWRLFSDYVPDLVLLDLDIPSSRGDELCRQIRADPRYRTLPIIFLSAADSDSMSELVFSAGADDYVKKPIVGSELVARMTSRLERARIIQSTSERDALAGLRTREKFETGWTRLIEIASRDSQKLTYVLLAIDGLSGITGRFGIDFGDSVQRGLTQALLRHFSGEHLIAQWVPGEIALALIGIGVEEAMNQVSELFDMFSSEPILTPDGSLLRVTCSASVGELHVDGDDLSEIYRRAEETLGTVRRLGGDKVVRVVENALVEATRVSEEIVIVDDDDIVGELLLHGLIARGYRCRRLTDGQSAVDQLTGIGQFLPALVILDVNLPGLDGFTVLEHFSRTGVLKTTKVIVLTARSSESEVMRALELGAFDHVTKPFSLPILLQRVHRALGD